MLVKSYTPDEQLQPFIDSYMFVDIDWRKMPSKHSIWRLIPFGQVSMLFLYADAHQYSVTSAAENMQNTSSAFMVGQLTKPIWLNFSGHTRLAKIQFKTGGIQHLLPFQLHEITNVPNVDLEAIWGRPVTELNEQLHNAEDDSDRCIYLNSFFKKRLLPVADQSAYISYTINHLVQTNGNYKLVNLKNKLGITPRHLERVFKHKVGLSPKDVGRFIRLNTAFSLLERKPQKSLNALCYELGYFDPSHFTRDFKQLTGVTPSALLSGNSNEYFVTKGKCFVGSFA